MVKTTDLLFAGVVLGGGFLLLKELQKKGGAIETGINIITGPNESAQRERFVETQTIDDIARNKATDERVFQDLEHIRFTTLQDANNRNDTAKVKELILQLERNVTLFTQWLNEQNALLAQAQAKGSPLCGTILEIGNTAAICSQRRTEILKAEYGIDLYTRQLEFNRRWLEAYKVTLQVMLTGRFMGRTDAPQVIPEVKAPPSTLPQVLTQTVKEIIAAMPLFLVPLQVLKGGAWAFWAKERLAGRL